MLVKTALVDLIEWKGLSHNQLARGLGIQKGKLSLIVNGKANPNPKEAEKLEQFFGMSISQLLESVEVTDGRNDLVSTSSQKGFSQSYALDQI